MPRTKSERLSKSEELTHKDVEDRLLVDCRHSCCICKCQAVQVHHIDGNHENWDYDNLIPLCPTHHSLVATKTTSTRMYKARQLKMYRDEWIAACKKPLMEPDYIKEIEIYKSQIRLLRQIISDIPRTKDSEKESS